MDFNMKQWRDQQQQQDEQQHQHYSKIPRQMFFDSSHDQTATATATAAAVAALPLFDSQPNKITTHLLDFHSSTPPTLGFKKMSGGGYCFSIEQWQELEVQALIFRHMMSGNAIPCELLQFVKKSLLTSSSSPYYFQPAAFLKGGYWGLGKGAMDPEPGRCRRTDGKKWRCSRDVVTGHKYCERHMHRGRNRSRKPVELSSSTGVNNGGGGGGGGSAIKSTPSAGGSIGGPSGRDGGEIHLSFSNAEAQLNHGASTTRHATHSSDEKSNKVLMQFFDDWPTSLQQETSTNNNNVNYSSSTTRTLAMSTNLVNPSSDFLRLSTGNGDELLGPRSDMAQRAESGWSVQWATNSVGPMGGPLAEALRSSTNSSPTSVLH